MKILKHKIFYIRLLLVIFCLVHSSCTNEKYKESTDETVNITEYLKNNEENYSLFLDILEISNYASFLNTYGTYTLFLPTNEAIDNYIEESGANTLEELNIENLQELVKLHILETKTFTTNFNDGKIATATMQGQFLVTGATNNEGNSSIVVNKESRIIQSNIEVGNGIIHVIDKVLPIATNTLAQEIESREELSIFTQALKETGWYDFLDQPITYDQDSISSHLSIIAQTNNVFASSGFNTYQELKNRYSNLDNPANPEDSLNLFVAYRILPGLKYVADLVTSPAHNTEAPQEVIGIKLAQDTVLINEQTFNGILEKGVPLNRDQSDITTTNGVIHLVKENFEIKKRFPYPVYFDPGDQPEIRRLASVFRIPGQNASFSQEDLQDVDWEGSNEISYRVDTPGGGTYGHGYFADVIEIHRLRDGYINNLTFTTPVIIKGTYKIWVSYRAAPSAPTNVQVYFNDEALSRQINFTEYGNTSQPERVLESQGYKIPVSPQTNRFNSRLLGIVNVESTGRHKIRFNSLSSAGQQTWIDVIEFRPIEMDQIYPRFSPNGLVEE
ncbi:fasciclin domain-containing protein [Zunongwangia atlantica]|uniref:Secreted surface protein with fasciclin-like repeat n=1 Tax=Zunongwangia atlantica 22II14-10F7 TaxID=1185767 RepID=A0A1Y1T0L6_9FLAO|nr:fasciclin domain-containing protein [Zunongwangia atlantica]ORL44144.1 secreted surface protein with fasciclin-like repeat [Zunongwangia atlantica 22II14-10F7]